MLDLQTFEKLETYDWEEIILDLTLYAKDKLDMLRCAKVKLPLAQQPGDYAKEAIRLIYEGQRTWDPKKNPDLAKFLKDSVVKSLIYNERISPGVKKRVTAKVPVKGNLEQEEELEFADVVPSREPLPDADVITEQTLANIRESLKGDDDAMLVYEELINSRKPIEIAKDLGISIEEVRNIVKRVRRKATGAID
jgi:hypothetical protein